MRSYLTPHHLRLLRPSKTFKDLATKVCDKLRLLDISVSSLLILRDTYTTVSSTVVQHLLTCGAFKISDGIFVKVSISNGHVICAEYHIIDTGTEPIPKCYCCKLFVTRIANQ